MSCIAYKKLKGKNIEPLLQKARKRHFRINIVEKDFLYTYYLENYQYVYKKILIIRNFNYQVIY